MKQLFFFILLLSFSCTKQENKPIVDVYGHAGISLHRDKAIFPANSFESIQYAIDVLGTDGVEVDVQMTKDSVLVLYHDQQIEEFSNIQGCISSYNYSEIKNLTLENSKYIICTLKEVIKFTKSRNTKVYLDAKTYTYCGDGTISINAFQYALNQSLIGISEDYKSQIVLGMLDLEFLKSVDYPSKCYENKDITLTINKAKENNFKAVLFHKDFISQIESDLLNNSGLYWGVFGIKDKWSIKSAIDFNPSFVITDNIAYTKQISN